ncbi:hypothetical protein ABZ691_26980 [Streptomyces sp. NPDC006854]|uniref:hypothetical protein n=1 Tax=Streptomyces sp. NPDC006854 TaxID=3155115 RepID=UPI0033F07317
MAAPAALPRPRGFVGGAARRRLRSVPAQAGPVVQLDVGNPLQLTETMRTRLLAAVRALLSDPGLKDADDPVRLATVVLVAKSKVATNYRATTTATELGRWVGLKPSRVAHHVLPQLRDRGVLGSNETVSAAGRVTGLECWVIPMYRAQHGEDRRHVLALSRVELVVLLKLIEVLFAPGWNHKDGRATPAGMIADRTGRGAATDRLGLLLMVLSSNAKGWLQLCSGSVDTERGRPAATVARLLGCSPAGGAKVLSRLQERDVLSVDRRETASGLNARSRVRLLPVAKAHGIAVREAREAADAVFSDLADTASGDHEMTVAAMAPVITGVHGIDEGLDPYSADRADAADLHASHASGVSPAGSLSLSGGFSGEGRGGEGRRPGRVRVRENDAVDHGTAMAGSGSLVAEDGTLRGEKPKKSPANQRVDQRTVEACAGGRLSAGGWERAQQEKGVDLPADLRLRVALGPVSSLWERLSGWQQGQVKAAAKAELAQLVGLGVAPEGAPQLLADRLTRRLTETGGEAMVAKPFGWMTGRGLIRRPSCSDRRCDDGIRLDTGDSCESCANVLHIHRARRAWMRADIDRELPGLAAGERRRILEERLRERVATEAENLARGQEQARAERARREAARAGAAEKAERERQAAAAADAVRQALACEDCGRGRAAGLCEACGYRRRTETLTVETGLLAATWAAVLDDRDDIDAVIAGVRASLEADIKHTQREFLESVEPGELDTDPVSAASVLAFAALQTVEAALSDYRSNALERLGRTAEAEAEARRAFRTEQNRRWFRHNPNGADAIAAATKAADTARERTAEYLLTTRLEQLREQTAARTEQVPAAPWTGRLHELAARPLDTDTAGAVIA